MHFSFVAYPHGLPRKQSPGISLQFSGPSRSPCPPVLELFWKSLFKIKSLHLQHLYRLRASFSAPFSLPIFYFYKYSHDCSWSYTGEAQAAAQMQLTVSPVNLTVVEAPEHLRVSGSVATPKLTASPLSPWNVPERQVSPTEQPRSHHKIKSDSREWKASSSIISPLKTPRLSLPLLPGLACCLQKRVLFKNSLYFDTGQSFSHCLNPFLIWLHL